MEEMYIMYGIGFNEKKGTHQIGWGCKGKIVPSSINRHIELNIVIYGKKLFISKIILSSF